jgi:hypothetical protein
LAGKTPASEKTIRRRENINSAAADDVGAASKFV